MTYKSVVHLDGGPRCTTRIALAAQLAADALCLQGRCSDVIVLGQSNRGATVAGVAIDFPQQVLLHAGAPVPVVPHAGRFTSIGERVLVAWRDRTAAARALRDA